MIPWSGTEIERKPGQLFAPSDVHPQTLGSTRAWGRPTPNDLANRLRYNGEKLCIPVGRFLAFVTVAAVMIGLGCSAPTKQEMLAEIEGRRAKSIVLDELGQPDLRQDVGADEWWTYSGADGELTLVFRRNVLVASHTTPLNLIVRKPVSEAPANPAIAGAVDRRLLYAK